MPANATDPHVDNFTDRIVDKCGGTLHIDDLNALGQFMLDGTYDVVNRVTKINPDLLQRFIISATTTSAVALDMTSAGIKTVLGADREGYPCRKVDARHRRDITDSTSMYYVNEDSDPVWYVHNDVFYIKPTVVNENGGATYYYLPHYQITNYDSGVSSIDHFPPDFYQHVCLYAAIQVIKRRILDTIDEQPDAIMIPVMPSPPEAPEISKFSTQVMASMPDYPTMNFPSLAIDLGDAKPGAMYWLETEEDSDLVGAYLSIVDKEISKYDKLYEAEKQKYVVEKEKFDKEFELLLKNTDMQQEHIVREYDLIDKELNLYTQKLSGYQNEMSEFTNKLTALEKQFTQNQQNVKERYEWLVNHAQVLQAEYEQLFGGGQKPPQQGGN
jgi:hypothetical protein